MKTSVALICASLAVMPMVAHAQQPAGKLKSSSRLSEDVGVRDSWSYRNEKVDVSKYKAFIIEPTIISADPAGEWGKVSDADKAKYAEMFTAALRDQIGKTYQLTTKKGPDVGTIRLTLLGVTPTSPVAIATRVTPMGLALNSVKSLAGKPGSLSGSAQIAFELTDSRSGELVAAAIRRRSPDALNISATTSTENTIAAVANDVAKAIKAGIDRANGG